MESKYNIVKELGRGQFGVAYMVQNKQTGEQFAMKKISIAEMSEDDVNDALNEITLLQQFDHPNIVKYIESQRTKAEIVIVMEYADQKCLDDLLKEQKSKGLFTEEQVLYYFVQIALGLKHIHDRRILHRDLKGANIFLASSKQDPRKLVIKIGDFGVSRVLERQDDIAHTCAGTPLFMAPEIFRGMGYNNKSDVWSIGCILYQLCTFNNIVKANSMQTLVQKLMKNEIPDVRDKYSQKVQDLLNLMLQGDPQKRASVRQILQVPVVLEQIPKLLPRDVIMREFQQAKTQNNVESQQQQRQLQLLKQQQLQQQQQQQLLQQQQQQLLLQQKQQQQQQQQQQIQQQQQQHQQNQVQQKPSLPTLPVCPPAVHNQPNIQQQANQQPYFPQPFVYSQPQMQNSNQIQRPAMPGDYQVQQYIIPNKQDYINQNAKSNSSPTLPNYQCDDFFGDKPRATRNANIINNSKAQLINRLGQQNFDTLLAQVKRKILLNDDTIDMKLCQGDQGVINQIVALLMYQQ